MGSQEANCPTGEIDPLASPAGVPLMEEKKVEAKELVLTGSECA